MNEKHITAILDVLANYFEGLYQADTEILSKVFHPDGHYINTLTNDYLNLSVADYFSLVDQRTPPAATNDKRDERIISIEIGSENMAFVKATMQMMGREYLDYLTLINEQNEWRIMTKVFSYQTMKEAI